MSTREEMARRLERLWTANKSAHPLYKTWTSIKERCFCITDKRYENYGKRGVSMAAEWYYDFWKFVLDMGHRPEGMSIERVNNSGHYTPDNCIWADKSVQVANRRKRKGRVVTVNGILFPSVSDAARILNVPRKRIQRALKGGDEAWLL